MLHLVKKAVMIYIWYMGKDPKELEIKMNSFYIISVFLPELACYAFGSIVIYSGDMEPCRYSGETRIKILWFTSIVLVIHSYLYFIVLLLIVIFFCYAYVHYVNMQKRETESKRIYTVSNKAIEILAKVPVINNLDVFALHKYKPQPTSPNDKGTENSPKLPIRSALKYPTNSLPS